MIEFLQANWSGIALALVGAGAAIANLTPTPKDDAAFSFLYKIVDFFALNWTKRSKQ